MDLSSLFSDMSVVFGVFCLGLLIVGLFGLSKAGKLTRDSRIIFIVMFVLVLLFLALTIFGK
jgi:hypothetical protein